MEEYFDSLSTNMSWVKNNTIYLTKHGSHAYGTNTPSSDLDIRGVCIAPKNFYLGLLDNFEQFITKHPVDITVFEISKFCKLAMDGNPNCLEIIFTESTDHIFSNKIGESLLNIREEFLSKKTRYTFAGYAFQQLRRLKLHRNYLLNGIKEKPLRSDYNLPENHKLIPEHQLLEIEAAIRKVLEDWQPDTTGMENDVAIKFKNDLYDILVELKINHDDMDLYAARYLGLNDNLIEVFKKERSYKLAMREYKNYQSWKQNRNPERAVLEEKMGFDGKFAMHLVRLYGQCIDLLKNKTLNVKRPDAQELLAIRNGAWSYEQLIEYAEQQDKILDDLYKTSTLPREPNRVKINNWLISTLERFWESFEESYDFE